MKMLWPLLLLLAAPTPQPDGRSVALSLAVRLEDTYVDRAAAGAIASLLRQRASAGGFDALDGDALAKALDAVIRSVTRDPHLGVRYTTDPISEPSKAVVTPEIRERQRRFAAAQNFGFEKVERLPGNVGFMELNGFVDPQIGGDTAIAAMAFLANTDALIVDLRYNSGGVPGIGWLISSYFFDRAVHLHSIEWRAGEGARVDQYWTLPFVPGRRMTTQPVFILTSDRTISAAESFAYSLQAIGRARIVGEVSAGGGHAGAEVPIGPQFLAFIPTGRAVNPLTGTNWEGTGIQPDVRTDEEEAAAAAHRLAVETLRDAATDAMTKARYQSVLDELKARQ
jgi:C-terminal processing protease CtpA/Prc